MRLCEGGSNFGLDFGLNSAQLAGQLSFEKTLFACMRRLSSTLLQKRLSNHSIARTLIRTSSTELNPSNQHQKMTPDEALHKFWGHESFRSVQKDIINSTIRGYDNLVVMATGAGKSLCFQIPPLITRRPCIIISPLISLMEDQVNALNSRLGGHATACFLGSAQSSHQVKADAWLGKHLFIYMTPELALNSTQEIKTLNSRVDGGLSFIAVDEAHCVSEW